MSAATVLIQSSRGVSNKLVGLVFAGALAFALLYFLVRPSGESSASAQSAPEFSLPAVAGGGTVSYIRSGKPAVINFFASWCIPCRRELPRLGAASTEYPGVSFIGIDYQDSRTQAQDLLTASGINYPSGYDPKGSVVTDYGITTGLPATVFVDKHGKVSHTTLGEITESDLDEQLSRLVAK